MANEFKRETVYDGNGTWRCYIYRLGRRCRKSECPAYDPFVCGVGRTAEEAEADAEQQMRASGAMDPTPSRPG